MILRDSGGGGAPGIIDRQGQAFFSGSCVLTLRMDSFWPFERIGDTLLVVELPVAVPVDADTAIIQECLAGNTDAFSVLVSRYRNGIYRFIHHSIGNETDAQDLAQETFVRAFANLKRFRTGAPFEPWIYTIAANLCRSHLRRSKWKTSSLDMDNALEELPAPADYDPAFVFHQQGERRRLLEAVWSLPADQRMVVVLRHLKEYSYREIAAILQLPVSTVEHRLRSARKTLRENLGDCPQFSDGSQRKGGAH
ncbi:MAG: RNA polymerase sigma factor [Chloroflexi bacterium]|nr:RNA polymerase sigma factor [Chloroflexota bacterium]